MRNFLGVVTRDLAYSYVNFAATEKFFVLVHKIATGGVFVDPKSAKLPIAKNPARAGPAIPVCNATATLPSQVMA